MSAELFLTLGTVFAYLEATPDSRCFVEGEAILNAKHVILIGTTNISEVMVEVLALCLQTSALRSAPHEIKGKLSVVEQKVEIQQLTCTCKAGLSGRCKHIAAVLIKCTRSNISTLEKLSSTDLKCTWNQSRGKVDETYESKPILETECFKGKVPDTPELSAEQKQKCFQLMTSICKDSGLSLHLNGRGTASAHISKTEVVISGSLEKVVRMAENSKLLQSMGNEMLSPYLQPCCRKIMTELINVNKFDEALTCRQGSEVWFEERQLRITGSRCYSIYTYSKEEWETKTENYFWPKPVNNKYIEHGKKYEAEALQKYKERNNYTICEIGLFICRKYPWFAYSPDGVVIENGVPTRLVEIKCPYDGIENDAINFVHTCEYLDISAERGITLKKKINTMVKCRWEWHC
ncbi:unnamed protein product [Callosobruchus maculatus]|uniref:SWIM-type domain-containing protein n=2 Tax=Callosobruchus maculatus TaxID=64391 RepID=A0A653CIW4_CALMS|nr:unnamed protein product [Callosobruchus maculatus]